MIDPKVTYIFEVLQTTAVGITDFSRLTGISRMTLHRWKKGGHVKDTLRREIAYKTALRLEKAKTWNELPLVDSYKPAMRTKLLRTIVKKMARM